MKIYTLGLALFLVTQAANAVAENVLSTAGFTSAAAQDAMLEVQLAKLALRRSHATGIRQFALMMVSDHTQQLQQLKSLAGTDPLAMPSSLDAPHIAKIQAFNKRGKSFDVDYVDAMIQAHDQAIALFTDAAGSANPDVAQFAKSALPMLQAHRERALALKAVKGTSSPM